MTKNKPDIKHKHETTNKHPYTKKKMLNKENIGKPKGWFGGGENKYLMV